MFYCSVGWLTTDIAQWEGSQACRKFENISIVKYNFIVNNLITKNWCFTVLLDGLPRILLSERGAKPAEKLKIFQLSNITLLQVNNLITKNWCFTVLLDGLPRILLSERGAKPAENLKIFQDGQGFNQIFCQKVSDFSGVTKFTYFWPYIRKT